MKGRLSENLYSKLGDFVQMFGPHLGISEYLVLVLSIKKEKLEEEKKFCEMLTFSQCKKP